MAATSSPGARAQSAIVRGLAALPDGRLARAVGRPVERDGQQLHVAPQLALRLSALAGEKDLADSSVAEARARITHDAATFEGPKVEVGSIAEVAAQGAEGPLRARLYTPAEADGPGPLLVYFHGGGFVVGDLDTHDNACRFLSRRSGVRVLAVDYRLAPECPFPGPFDDAVAAFRSAAERCPEFGADPDRLGVAGDSAGGNL